MKALRAPLVRALGLTARSFHACLRSGPHKPTVSHPLNRFGGNMGPYVDAMLPLRSVEYINASPIDNLGEGAPWFVATMCPKRETFAHFWSMVWEMGSRVIINLTHERDRVGSGPSDKRERYWPPFNDVDERELAHWPILPRTLFTESCEQVPALLRYAIELSGPVPRDGGPRPTRVVALYWYSRWIDFPSSTSIGSRPFYENAWAVLHIAMHVNSELVRRLVPPFSPTPLCPAPQHPLVRRLVPPFPPPPFAPPPPSPRASPRPTFSPHPPLPRPPTSPRPSPPLPTSAA